MRVLLITSNSLAAQVSVRRVIQDHHTHIVGVVIPSSLRGSLWKRTLRSLKLVKSASFKFLLFRATESSLYPAYLRIRKRPVLTGMFRSHGIPYLKVNDVADALPFIKEAKPDLILNLYATQFLSDSISKLAPIALNLHGSLLPDYRGSAPYFWVLAENQKLAGVTLHEISSELDAGPIVKRQTLPLLEGESVYHFHHRLSALGGEVVSQFLSDCIQGKPFKATPQTETKGRYRFPTSREVREFKGHLITLRDFVTLT